MHIKLYVFPGGDGIPSISPPCVRVQLALARAGVVHDTVFIKSRGEASKFSITGRLPAIDIDGSRYSDSLEILDELERRLPDLALTPSDATARMRDRLWEHYVNDHLYWLGYYMRWVDPEGSKRFVGSLLARAPFMMRMLAPTMLTRAARRRSREVGILGKSRDEVLRGFDRALDIFDTALTNGPFLEGRDEPGRGDLAVASMICQAGFRDTMPEMMERVAPRQAIVDHTRRVFEACNTAPPRWMTS